MSLLSPTSIAVIGASATDGKVGHEILQNLLEQGYKQPIYPINPNEEEILGIKVYSSVLEVPKEIDLAIIVIPAKIVPSVLRECGKKGIRNIIVISAGFGEVHTKQGDALEAEILAIAKEHDLRLVGPNCLGILRPSLKLNASFAKNLPPAGPVALISQSGATAVGLIDAAPHIGLGCSVVLSIGNKTVLDAADFLELCAEDEDTQVIGLYLESVKDGRRFVETARRISPKKPIVLLKSGVSEQGKKAASSHTGALAGNDSAVDAACRAGGIHRAHTLSEFLDLLRVLSSQPPLQSSKIAIVTNAGGPGILASDAAAKQQLRLPSLTPRTAEPLKKVLPAAASTTNPLDVLGDAGADRYQAALEACGNDPNIDGVVLLLTPQVMTPVQEVAQTLITWSQAHPLMPVVTSFIGGEAVQEGRRLLHEHGIPSFDTPEAAIAALAALRPRSLPPDPTEITLNNARATEANSLLQNHQGLLSTQATTALLKLYDLEVPRQAVATSAEQAVSLAKEMGFPVVAKVQSADIVHKTDMGGIHVNLKDEPSVQNAYREIEAAFRKHAPKAEWSGVLIQQFLPAGDEYIVGGLRDSSFGPLVMAGLGGVYTELFGDTSFRLAPVSAEESYTLLQELTAWKLLKGMRGKPPAAIDALAEVIQKISLLLAECPQITELDLNPVLVTDSTVHLVDAKVLLIEGSN